MSEIHTTQEASASIAARIAALKAEQDALTAQLVDAEAEYARPHVEYLLTQHECVPSAKSTFVGFYGPKVTIEINGREYLSQTIVTDIAAKAERDEAAKAEREEEKRRDTLAKQLQAAEQKRDALAAKFTALGLTRVAAAFAEFPEAAESDESDESDES